MREGGGLEVAAAGNVLIAVLAVVVTPLTIVDGARRGKGGRRNGAPIFSDLHLWYAEKRGWEIQTGYISVGCGVHGSSQRRRRLIVFLLGILPRPNNKNFSCLC